MILNWLSTVLFGIGVILIIALAISAFYIYLQFFLNSLNYDCPCLMVNGMP